MRVHPLGCRRPTFSTPVSINWIRASNCVDSGVDLLRRERPTVSTSMSSYLDAGVQLSRHRCPRRGRGRRTISTLASIDSRCVSNCLDVGIHRPGYVRPTVPTRASLCSTQVMFLANESTSPKIQIRNSTRPTPYSPLSSSTRRAPSCAVAPRSSSESLFWSSPG